MKADIDKKNAVIVIGTDTNAGKTVVCGLLGRFLKENHHKVITQKWVQTGSKGFSQDIAAHLALMGVKKNSIAEFLNDIVPYQFKFPASPHLAAGLENKNISAAKIKKSFMRLRDKFDFVIVEAAGGALVPLNGKMLLIDIAQQLRLPVLLVVNNKLGAINHSLLTIESLQKRGMKITGIVFNNIKKNEKRQILDDNIKIIAKISGEKALGCISYSKNADFLHKEFKPIGEKILSELRKKT